MSLVPDIKAVLFDLDGTLVDSLPEIHHGLVELAREMGWPEPGMEDSAAMIGRGARVLVERYMAFAHRTGDVDELLSKLIGHWARSGGRNIGFYPGVLDGIRELRRNGVKTALVTNKYRDLTLDFLKEHGIEDLFDTVVAGDDCENPKPARDMLDRALSELGVDRFHAVMVGDSRNDALAARAAGVTAVLVETGYNEGVNIRDWAREAGFNVVHTNARKVCDLINQGAL